MFLDHHHSDDAGVVHIHELLGASPEPARALPNPLLLQPVVLHQGGRSFEVRHHVLPDVLLPHHVVRALGVRHAAEGRGAEHWRGTQ